jgi:Flp pilus assembly protein TadB
MKNERFLILWVASVSAIIVVLMFLTLATHSVYYAMAAALAFISMIFSLAVVYLRTFHNRNVKDMVHELKEISK